MFIRNIKKLSFTLLLFSLLAWACGNNGPKEINDEEEVEAFTNDEYEVRGDSDWEKTKLERDALVPTDTATIVRGLDPELSNPNNPDHVKDDLDLEDKNDLPAAKVIRSEPIDYSKKKSKVEKNQK